jgi:O-antigen ligase
MLGVYEVLLIAQLFLLHLYIASSVNSREDVKLIIRYLLIGLAAQSLIMIALAGGLAEWGVLEEESSVDDQSIAGVTRQVHILGLKARIDENIETGQSRVGGSLGSPNDASGFLVCALGIALGVPLTRLGARYKVLAALGAGLGVTALVLTFSRGGWLAFVLTFGIVGYAASRRKRIAGKRPLLLAAGLVLVVSTFFSNKIGTRLTADDNGAAMSRVPLMKLAALIIEDHPLLGAGANNFPVAMQDYITRGFAGEFIYSVHNKYLLVLSETGPGGLLAFLWFLLAMILRGIRCWRFKDPLISPLSLSCVAAVTGTMLHMFVDIFRGEPIMQLLCVISALLAALERMATAPYPARLHRGWTAIARSADPLGYGVQNLPT